MSKKHHHNYTNYSKPQQVAPAVEPEVTEEVMVEETVETVEPEVIEEVVEEPEVKSILGVVTGCAKLNVREEANAEADVLCTINLGAEVMINKDESTDTFYKVVTGAGVEGFCMKKFININ